MTHATDPPARAMTFHTPGRVFLFTFLFFPVGLGMYALNALRRGQKRMGPAILILSAFVGGLLVLDIASGGPAAGMGALGFFFAWSLFHREEALYERDIDMGAEKARWWPPLLFLLGAWTVAFLLTVLFIGS